jgi:hypothetical protein
VVDCVRAGAFGVASAVRGSQCASRGRLTLIIASLTMSVEKSQYWPANTVQPTRGVCDSGAWRKKGTHQCSCRGWCWRRWPSWARLRRSSWEALWVGIGCRERVGSEDSREGKARDSGGRLLRRKLRKSLG